MASCGSLLCACSFILVLLILLSGFALKRPDVHPWWIWVYWASPITVSFLNCFAQHDRACVLHACPSSASVVTHKACIPSAHVTTSVGWRTLCN